jgi:hypothetical protein
MAMVAVLWSVWLFWLEPDLILANTRKKQMYELSAAMIRFNTSQSRLPTNLNELVCNGLLPPVGAIYACPATRGKLIVPPVPFENCEFAINFGVTNIVIRVPQSNYDAQKVSWRFSRWPANSPHETVYIGDKYPVWSK